MRAVRSLALVAAVAVLCHAWAAVAQKETTLRLQDAGEAQPLPGASDPVLSLDPKRSEELSNLFTLADSETTPDKAIGVATDSIHLLPEVVHKAAEKVLQQTAEKTSAPEAVPVPGQGVGPDGKDATGAKAVPSVDPTASAAKALKAAVSPAAAKEDEKKPPSGTSVTYTAYTADKTGGTQGTDAQQNEFPVDYSTFRKFDADSNGELSYKEFGALVRDGKTEYLPGGSAEYEVTLGVRLAGIDDADNLFVRFQGAGGALTDEVPLPGKVEGGKQSWKVKALNVAYVSNVHVRRGGAGSGGAWNVTYASVRVNDHVTSSFYPHVLKARDVIPLASPDLHLRDTIEEQALGGDVQDPWTRAHYDEYRSKLADFVAFVDQHMYEQHQHNLDAAGIATSVPAPTSVVKDQDKEAQEEAEKPLTQEPGLPTKPDDSGSNGNGEQEDNGEESGESGNDKVTPVTTGGAAAASVAKTAEQQAKDDEEDREEAYRRYVEKARVARLNEEQKTVDTALAKKAAADKAAADAARFKAELNAKLAHAAAAKGLAGIDTITAADLKRLETLHAAMREQEEHGKDKPKVDTPATEADEAAFGEAEESARADAAAVAAPASRRHLPVSHNGVPHVSSRELATNAPWAYAEFSSWPGATCQAGKRQSPVALSSKAAKESSTLRVAGDTKLSIHYQRAPFGTLVMRNTGHGMVIEANGRLGHVESGASHVRYAVDRIEFHGPSEHTLDTAPAGANGHYDVEMQIWHRKSVDSSEGEPWLVVSVMFASKGGADDSSFLEDQLDWDKLPSSPGTVHALAGYVDLRLAAEWQSPYFSYLGSSTQPPCTENVEWRVLQQPSVMSAGQRNAYNARFRDNKAFAFGNGNNRPVQELNGRAIVITK